MVESWDSDRGQKSHTLHLLKHWGTGARLRMERYAGELDLFCSVTILSVHQRDQKIQLTQPEVQYSYR